MRILAIGAHLDDIEVACGATIAKATAKGHAVRMVVLSQSDYANYRGDQLRGREQALAEGTRGAEALGVTDLVVLANPTKDIPHTSATVEQIEAQLDDFKPSLILTHWSFDTHQAHQGVSLASISAARHHASILMYEPTPPSGRSYVAFRPQVYVDVTGYLPHKLASLKAHVSQYEKYGPAWLEAIEGRARYRGFEAGVTHAETYEVVRMGLEL